MDYIKAFVIGGAVCVLVQILMDKTKLLPGRIMVILVCIGAVLGAIGIYEPFLEFAGCGASVPLSGFGYNLWKGIKEAVDQDGFIGLFRGGFKMAAVGTSAALIFSYLASLIFKPKMVSIFFYIDPREQERSHENDLSWLPFTYIVFILLYFYVCSLLRKVHQKMVHR